MGGAWDQTRATFEQQRAASAIAAANDILFVDLVLRPQSSKHYIISQLALVARLTVRDALDPPISGLFLVPIGEPAPGVVWSPGSRGIPIPLSACYCCSVPLGTNFASSYVAQPGYKITVPRDYTIRGIIQCSETGATAGPGALSELLVKGLVVEEPDCGFS